MLPYKIRGIRIVALGSAVLIGLVAACADSPTRECRVGADCATGVCGVDGVCTREAAPGGTDGGPDADASSAVDGAAKDAASDSALPGCSPNKDGTITRDEVPIAAGLHATYKIGKNEAGISTAGTPAAGNKRVWDFSAALASDASVLVETQALTGKWYAPKFPGATYASKLSESSDLLGVFETSPGALLLRGVVSPTEASPKTELTETPAVVVLKFPLTMGATWNTDANVSGTFKDTATAFFGVYTEKYTSEVDAAGTLKTPLGTFDVLRVKVVLVRTVGVIVTTIQSFAFVTECYGTIATVTSKDNETNVEFTDVAEIRRISP